jgi:hypothetical protein
VKKWVLLLVALLLLLSLLMGGCGAKEHSLTLTIDVDGEGTTSPSVGDHTYDEGKVVTITATPRSGWKFDGWTGDIYTVDDPDAARTTIVVDGDYDIIANFVELEKYTLTLDVDPEGGGTTSPSVGDHTYDEGTVVTITATPRSGWEFDSWIGDVDTIDDVYAASTTITMDDNYDIIAEFVEI